MTPPPAPPRRSRFWLLVSLAANVLLGLLWLGAGSVHAPGPPALPVGEAVVLRTPGGRLEVAELQQLESFEVSRDHTVLGVPVGSTFSRIRVPAHYRYHVELAPEWTVRVLPDGGVRVIAPRVRPTLPVAIDTGRMEKESRGLWSLFTGPEQMAALEKGLTDSLGRKAGTAPLLARQREAARATVAEFVAKWLISQSAWKPLTGKSVQVVFADEPIETLDALCGGAPGCAAERLARGAPPL